MADCSTCGREGAYNEGGDKRHRIKNPASESTPPVVTCGVYNCNIRTRTSSRTHSGGSGSGGGGVTGGGVSGSAETSVSASLPESASVSVSASSFCDDAMRADRLISVVEKFHALGMKQQRDKVVLEEGSGASRLDDFPLFLPQCEELFTSLYTPALVQELSDVYMADVENHVVNRLRVFFSSYQQMFLSGKEKSDVLQYEGFCYPLNVLLQILSATLQQILTTLKQEQQQSNDLLSLTVESIPNFLENMIRLLKLDGLQDSVYKLMVEFSKLVQTTELTCLRMAVSGFEDHD